MLSTGAAAKHYLQTHVRSRTPLELVVMLYDAAIRSTEAAASAADKRDIRTRRDEVSRVMAIISELQNNLDMERGGAIAAELDRVYGWMTSRLLDATVQQDATPLREVHRVLNVLRDGWQQIASGAPAPAERVAP